MSFNDQAVDVAIVGAGPAGLQAALKVALLGHTAIVFDKGRKHSRIFFAPVVANTPGAPGGARGSDIIKAGREHLAQVNEKLGREHVRLLDNTEVTDAERTDDGFRIEAREVKTGEATTWTAKVLFVAAGMVDRQPWIKPEDKGLSPILPYANKGLVDYCLLCDGHTVTDKRVVVIGMDRSAVGIASTLRESWNADVTVVACVACVAQEHDHDHPDHKGLFEAAKKKGIPAIDASIEAISGLKDDRVVLEMTDGSKHTFDKAFMAFGWWKVNHDLAVRFGGATDPAGHVKTDPDCQVLDADGAVVPRVYAIGDLRSETWNQVPSAWADGETAAIHAWATHL